MSTPTIHKSPHDQQQQPKLDGRYTSWRYASGLGFMLSVLLSWSLLAARPPARRTKAQARRAAPKARTATNNPIFVWTRLAGHYTKTKAKTPKRTPVLLQSFPAQTRKLFDFQTNKTQVYKGVWLSQLLKTTKAPKYVDTAMLHFANGMRVPLPLHKLGKVFVAYAYQKPGTKAWSRAFPALPKSTLMKDARPIRFTHNKIVVSHRDHPDVPDKIEKSFTPWRYVDTLTGIELIDADAYYGQFAVTNKASHRKGLRHFRQMCQFCHGARKVGARFGVDFVVPNAAYLYRYSANNLYMHVKYRVIDAPMQGLMMPALKHVTREEIADLWLWLRAIATKPMKPYKPTP